MLLIDRGARRPHRDRPRSRLPGPLPAPQACVHVPALRPITAALPRHGLQGDVPSFASPSWICAATSSLRSGRSAPRPTQRWTSPPSQSSRPTGSPKSGVAATATRSGASASRMQHLKRRPGRELLLLLQFQSRDVPDMALRILGYVVELYRDLEAHGVVRPGTAVRRCTRKWCTTGRRRGGQPVEVAELIALPDVPAQVRRDLATLQPLSGCTWLTFPVHRQEDLVPGNVVSLQIGFEYAGPSDYARLLPAVAELADAGLRRTVYEWVVRRARRDGVDLGEMQRGRLELSFEDRRQLLTGNGGVVRRGPGGGSGGGAPARARFKESSKGSSNSARSWCDRSRRSSERGRRSGWGRCSIGSPIRHCLPRWGMRCSCPLRRRNSWPGSRPASRR